MCSFAQEGESRKTGIRLMTHLKIHICMKITVRATITSIHEGTYRTTASHLYPMIETFSLFIMTPIIVNMAAILIIVMLLFR